MIRKIIKIDENRCNGCGICAKACHEGAIGMVDGKARLLREDYCDGLGDCLPSCPTGAITFEEREAPAYDEEAVKAAKQAAAPLPCGCPGTQARRLERKPQETADIRGNEDSAPSELRQWPVQIRLAPAKAPYFENAHLLIAADCAAYAYGAFHRDFIKNRIALIGCPKLDAVDYAEKLTEKMCIRDSFYMPHSRYTSIEAEDIEKHPHLQLLAMSETAGVAVVSTRDARQVFITGHCEYDRYTLAGEYHRDVLRGLRPSLPQHYFPGDDPEAVPPMIWRSHANLLFSNWLNYFVYQQTPYDLESLHHT